MEMGAPGDVDNPYIGSLGAVPPTGVQGAEPPLGGLGAKRSFSFLCCVYTFLRILLSIDPWRNHKFSVAYKRIGNEHSLNSNETSTKLITCLFSGVARNLSRGEQIRGGLGDGSPPAGFRGFAPVGVWGLRPQKLTSLPLKCSEFWLPDKHYFFRFWMIAILH